MEREKIPSVFSIAGRPATQKQEPLALSFSCLLTAPAPTCILIELTTEEESKKLTKQKTKRPMIFKIHILLVRWTREDEKVTIGKAKFKQLCIWWTEYGPYYCYQKLRLDFPSCFFPTLQHHSIFSLGRC